jgi:hypothetical protein
VKTKPVKLLPSQRALLEAIVILSRLGYPPTIRELMAHFGVTGRNGMWERLDRLLDRRCISMARLPSGIAETRSIRVLVPIKPDPNLAVAFKAGIGRFIPVTRVAKESRSFVAQQKGRAA